MSGLYVIAFRKIDLGNEHFEADLAKHGAWIRINGQTYILSTDKVALQIYGVCGQHMLPTDSVVVFKLDPADRTGWMPKWVWDWIDERVKSNQNSLLSSQLQALLPNNKLLDP